MRVIDRRLLASVALVLVSMSCVARAPVAASVSRARSSVAATRAPAAAADPMARVPAPSPGPDTPFPEIFHERLNNGLELRVVPRHDHPVLQLILQIGSGAATDGAEPGVAALAAELLKAGGAGAWNAAALTERAESLGSSLDVVTGRDSTRVSMAVTNADFASALELIGAVVQAPRFTASEFDKLKQRELDRVRDESRSSPEWAGSMLLYRKLFQTAAGVHPYARFDALPSELQSLTQASCQRWYRSQVTPANATLIVAGDIDAEQAKSATEHVFANWKGARPEPPRFDPLVAQSERVVWVVDRPGSAQSQLYVAGLGPERASISWPAVAAANQVLGGGVAGRLFADVREKRSLAYHTGSILEEPAHGPAPIVLSAGTQTAKTGLALQALLFDAEQLAQGGVTAAEVGMASRYLSDTFLFGTETVGGLAGLTAKLALFGLPDRYFDDYRKAEQQLDAKAVSDAARHFFAFDKPVIVVAGDASRISRPLSHFAAVRVVDPEHGFGAKLQLPMDVNAALEAQPLPVEPAK